MGVTELNSPGKALPTQLASNEVSSADDAAVAAHSITLPTRRCFRFAPHLALLMVLGALYLSVEFYSFSGATISSGADTTYHVLTDGERKRKELTAERKVGDDEASSRLPRVSREDQQWLDRHADELGCDFSFQKVNPDCPRFVHLPVTRGGGLGNKYFTYILGLLLAMDMKATHLYTGAEFAYQDHQDHGSYPWVEDVLGFGYRELNYSRAVNTYKPEVVEIGHQVWQNVTRDYADRCNVLFLADDFVCNYMICYYSETPKVYHRIKSVVRCKAMHSRVLPPPLKFEPDTYNVAWHIRMGDSGPNARLGSIHGGDEAYYTRCRQTLDEVLRGFRVTYHFFAESPESGSNSPPGFEFLAKLFPEARYHTSMDPQLTLVHMMSADMLITSGSSFSFVAASVSYKPVVLFDRPKEGFFFGVYMDEDYVKLDNGLIVDQSLSEVRALVTYKYALFHEHIVPGTIRVPRNSTAYEHDALGPGNLGRSPPAR